jgi:peptide/nickel transport system permease protein
MPELPIDRNYGEANAENWDVLQDAPDAPITELDAYSMAEVKARGQWATAGHRFVRSPRAMGGLLVFIGVMLYSFFYTLVHPHQYTDLGTVLLHAPTSGHPLGTNQTGQDVFALIMKGALQDVQIAVVVAVMSTVIGILIGATAGFYGGKVDSILMRFTDFILVIPVIIILLQATGLLWPS